MTPPKYNKVVRKSTIKHRFLVTGKKFSNLGHECEMLAEEDEVEKKYPGHKFMNKFKRSWVRCILVHEKICKSCAIHLRSHGAIEKEKHRHIRYHPTTIHPFSSAR